MDSARRWNKTPVAEVASMAQKNRLTLEVRQAILREEDCLCGRATLHDVGHRADEPDCGDRDRGWLRRELRRQAELTASRFPAAHHVNIAIRRRQSGYLIRIGDRYFHHLLV